MPRQVVLKYLLAGDAAAADATAFRWMSLARSGFCAAHSLKWKRHIPLFRAPWDCLSHPEVEQRFRLRFPSGTVAAAPSSLLGAIVLRS